MKQLARPICLIILVITLCGMAMGEACGYSTPTWFLGFAIPVAGGLMVERAVRKSKGEK